uniref:Uncharacterized protein n=1 Tax=Arundo donax TaxID=35708 RepID=A0A0A8ZA42_ARUDO
MQRAASKAALQKTKFFDSLLHFAHWHINNYRTCAGISSTTYLQQ